MDAMGAQSEATVGNLEKSAFIGMIAPIFRVHTDLR